MTPPEHHISDRPVSSRRVCIFAPDFGDGGVERMLVNIASGISRLKIDVDFIVSDANAPYLHMLPDEVSVTETRTSDRRKQESYLSDYINKSNPSIVLTAKTNADSIALQVKQRLNPATRFFLRPGTTVSERLRAKGINPIKRWYHYRQLKKLYWLADGIVTVSEGVADDIVQISGLPRERISVIRNPNITPEMALQAAEQVDHDWFRPGHVPVVIGMGGLRRQKDFSTLIHAFALVRRELPCRLLILGEGRQHRKLEALGNRLGLVNDIQLPGFSNNPYALLSRCQLFVLSSLWEGSPNVLTEALALGVPVVSTDCPSGPREILQNGRFGPLLPTGDVRGLADAMLEVLRAPPKAEFLKTAVTDYTIEKSARAYLRAFGLMAGDQAE